MSKSNKPFVARELKTVEENFCQHFAEYGNATLAYQYAYGTTYNSARTNASRKLTDDNIKLRVQEIKEHFATMISQSKDKTIKDLLDAAEEAKMLNRFADYAKLRDMVIKMCGFYEPVKTDVTSGGEKITIKLDLGTDKED